MSVILKPPGNDLRLLASLAAWTWPEPGADNRDVAHILLTHSPALGLLGGAKMVESHMRRLAGSFGGLGGAEEVVPDAGPCLQIVGEQVLLHPPGASRRLRLPTCPGWICLITDSREAVLMIGLDPLSQAATPAEVDGFLDTALAADRLLFGRARTP